MSYILSFLIALPLAAAPAAYFLTKLNRKFGVYSSLVMSGIVLAIAGYVFWSVYSGAASGSLGQGQYLLEEQRSWLGTAGFGLNYWLGVDGLSSPLIFVSALLTLLAIFGSKKLIDKHEPEFYALIFLFEGAIMGVFTSLNLILFYVFWEVVLIPMFFFIGVWGGPRRKYAALKFIVFTYAGSTIMLLGFLYVYLGMQGLSFDIPVLAGRIPAGLQYLPLLASFIGFAVKLPLVPFHTWLPDAHVEAPSPISVLLAGVLLKMGGYGFLRISIGLFPKASAEYAWAFLAAGLFSMFYGAAAAILQKDLKKMIAFTSINHMGFVLFGAYATLVSGSLLGIQGAIFQMFTHALAVGSLFMLSGYIHHQAGTREIPLLKGLGTTMPRTAAILVLSSAAAMGLPPFASFLAEFMVISAGIAAYPITAVSILVPVITAGYFLWMIRRTTLSPPEGGSGRHDMGWSDVAAFAVYLIPLVVFIVTAYLILTPALPVAEFLKGLAHP